MIEPGPYKKKKSRKYVYVHFTVKDLTDENTRVVFHDCRGKRFSMSEEEFEDQYANADADFDSFIGNAKLAGLKSADWPEWKKNVLGKVEEVEIPDNEPNQNFEQEI